MWDNWFRFGQTEIINNELARAMAEQATVPMWWFKGRRFPSQQDALQTQFGSSGELGTDYGSDVTATPWYDPSLPEASSNFFGVYCLGTKGIVDGSRTVPVVEGIGAGGTLGTPRKAVKSVTFTVLLAARGWEALEYGMRWLDAALDADSCGNHGDICGLTDMTFLADAPPVRGFAMSNDDYSAIVQSKMRFFHGVGATSSPMVSETMESNGFMAYLVDFTVTVTQPWIFQATKDLALLPSRPVVVQDIPYNLATYPSFELAGAQTVVVATNYARNPSAESSVNFWSANASAVSGADATPYMTQASSTDISSVGTASYRVRILGNGSTEASGRSQVVINQPCPFPGALASGQRISVGMWIGAFATAAQSLSAIQSMKVTVQWKNSAGTTIREDALGTPVTAPPFTGQAFFQAGMQPPAGTTSATVLGYFVFDWVSSATAANNSDTRLYADALVVTVP